jgi:hypothetical protein
VNEVIPSLPRSADDPPLPALKTLAKAPEARKPEPPAELPRPAAIAEDTWNTLEANERALILRITKMKSYKAEYPQFLETFRKTKKQPLQQAIFDVFRALVPPKEQAWLGEKFGSEWAARLAPAARPAARPAATAPTAASPYQEALAALAAAQDPKEIRKRILAKHFERLSEEERRDIASRIKAWCEQRGLTGELARMPSLKPYL